MILTPTVLLQRNTLSSAAALFTSLALNAAKSSILFGRIKRHPKAWWSAEVEGAASERRKAFAVAHRSDEDRQVYISASRRVSSVIAKAEEWQTTCSSLSPKSNPKFVSSRLCSIAGFPSSSSSSPNFPNCSSLRESASVYAAYLRSHFSVSQPKALRSRARGHFSELRRATCPEKSRLSCSPFPLNFLRLPATSPRPLPLARTPLISFCTVQLRTLCAADSLATLGLSTTSGPDLGELPGFWGSMVFRHAFIPWKGSGKQQEDFLKKHHKHAVESFFGRYLPGLPI